MGEEITSQNVLMRIQPQHRKVSLNKPFIRHGKVVSKTEQHSGLFKRIQLPVRQVIPQGKLKGSRRVATFFWNSSRQRSRHAQPCECTNPAKSADDYLARIPFKKKNRIQLSDFPQRIHQRRGFKLLADPESFVFKIYVFKRYLLDKHGTKDNQKRVQTTIIRSYSFIVFDEC